MANPHPPLPGAPSGPLGAKLASSDSARAVLDPEPQPTGGIRYRGVELWLHRLNMLLFVFLCASVGVLLVILPWRSEWLDNHLLLGLPRLRAFLANGFVRGLVSGMGVLDIWIGFWEAVHYHEHT